VRKFSIATDIIIGKEEGAQIFAGMSRVMIVTDQFMHESGKVSYVTDMLNSCQIKYVEFSDVKPDPDIETVSRGVGIIKEFDPQAVIAFGGGSPIDAAKAMVYFAALEAEESRCTLIAIPTTSGTGSEVTRFAIISDPVKNAKYSLVDDRLLPDYSILDAELIKSVPPSVTADTGMDVLTHAIEAIVSKEANDFTDAAAEKAIFLFHKHLLRAYDNPLESDARSGMHNASCLAGMAFSNAGLGINHGMAHTLGAHFHIPHGRANAILLPYVISYNAGLYDELNETAGRYAVIAKLLQVESVTPRQSCLNLIRCIKYYVDKLQMPATIQEAGVKEEDFLNSLDDMVNAAIADRCTATNPRECGYQEIHRLFRIAYYGK
jgi:alcohol dehydrogenase class IV